jgi:CO/xanthine dehydrogenase Mo-binding subunit
VDLAGLVLLVLAIRLLSGVHVNASPAGAGSHATNAQMVTGERNVKVRHLTVHWRDTDLSVYWRVYAM